MARYLNNLPSEGKSVQDGFEEKGSPGPFCSAWWHARQDRWKELNCFGDDSGGGGVCIQNYN